MLNLISFFVENNCTTKVLEFGGASAKSGSGALHAVKCCWLRSLPGSKIIASLFLAPVGSSNTATHG